MLTVSVCSSRHRHRKRPARPRRRRTRRLRQGGDHPSPQTQAPHFARRERKRQCKFHGAKCNPVHRLVVLDRLALAFSPSAVRRVLRLTQLRCWVVPGRDPSSSAGSVRRVPSLHSKVEFNQVATPPGSVRGPRGIWLRRLQCCGPCSVKTPQSLPCDQRGSRVRLSAKHIIWYRPW